MNKSTMRKCSVNAQPVTFDSIEKHVAAIIREQKKNTADVTFTCRTI